MDVTTVVRFLVAVRNVLKYLPFLSPEDPQVIREKYNTRLVAKVRKKYGSAETDSKGNVPQQERMRAWADWYCLRAKILWGRPDPRHRHRSAWLYVTAAELYEHGKAPSQAQDCYHFAAHGFRELNSLAQALKFYQQAANVAKTLNDKEWTVRSLRRAKGIAAEMADDQKLAELDAAIGAATALPQSPQPPQISN